MDVEALTRVWRQEALAGQAVSHEERSGDGGLLNYHARVVERPIAEVYGRLARMGTGLDDVWPLASVPMKTDGELRPGVTAAHGPIRYELVSAEEDRRIEWRFTLERLHGRYEYRVERAAAGTLIENVIDGSLSGELVEVWPAAVSAFHDWVIERIFDRLAEPGAPWFDAQSVMAIR